MKPVAPRNWKLNVPRAQPPRTLVPISERMTGAIPRDPVFSDSRKASAKAKVKISLAPIKLPDASGR